MANAKAGIIWSAVERFSVQGTQFILSLIIARLVTPSDFGLIAMLSIFMAIAQVFTDSGFGSALIQKKDRNDVDYSTVFYFNLGIAICLYLVLYLSAPLISSFYKEPRLIDVTRCIGLNLIFLALCLIQRTILRIHLNFKKIATISLISMLLSGTVGVYLAYIGYGVWALVLQTLINNFLLALLFWLTTYWKPLLVFSVSSFKRLFSFGSKLLVSHLLHTVYLNLYSLVIGRFYNASDVGYYNRAYTIAQYPPVNLVMIITNVMYPIQCEHQNDKKWMIETFPEFIRMTCFVVFPVMVLLAIVAKPFVLIVLSEKWIQAAPLISILAIAYMWIAIGTLNNNIINASGRSDLYLKAEVIKKVIAIVILIATIPFGILWLCIGLLIYNLIYLVIIIHYTKKIFPLGYILQLRACLPILTLSIISGLISCVVNVISGNNWIILMGNIIIFSICYIIGGRYICPKEIKLLLSFMKK